MHSYELSITGTGSSLPQRVVSNEEIPGYRAANGMWRQFWGVKNRYMLSEHEDLVDLGSKAVLNALEMAGLAPRDLDVIIVGSSMAAGLATADSPSMFPRPGARIRNRLGADRAVALDVEAGCASFIVGLEMAASYIRSGRFERVAIVTVDVLSRILDLTDPSGIIFGDGSGAAIVERSGEEKGYIHSRIFSDSSYYDLAGVKWKLPKEGVKNYRPYFYVDSSLKMTEFVPQIVPKAIRHLLKDTGMKPDDIDLFVLHQPGRFLLEQWKKELGLTAERAPDIHEECACLSSSSVAVTLDRVVRDGRLKKGCRFIMAGAGIGWTWGAHLWVWQGPDQKVVKGEVKP